MSLHFLSKETCTTLWEISNCLTYNSWYFMWHCFRQKDPFYSKDHARMDTWLQDPLILPYTTELYHLKLLIPYKTLEWLLKDAIKAQLVMIPCGVGAHLSGWYIYLEPITTIQCYAPDYRNTWAQEPSGKIGTDASHHHVQCPLGEFVLPPLKHSV